MISNAVLAACQAFPVAGIELLLYALKLSLQGTVLSSWLRICSYEFVTIRGEADFVPDRAMQKLGELLL
jgi:hypothetical protein